MILAAYCGEVWYNIPMITGGTPLRRTLDQERRKKTRGYRGKLE
jgi:hypothetical protein